MNAASGTLPSGRRGQALALAITIVLMAIVWLGVIAPLLDWYSSRTAYLEQQEALAVRMRSVAATAPGLQQKLTQAEVAPPPRSVFEGATDAVAGAALQQAVQDMASRAGATVLSAEMLPVEPVAGYRRIGVRLTVSAGWPVLISLLNGVLQATPRMLVDDLTLRQTEMLGALEAHPMEANFTVTALHVAPPAVPPVGVLSQQ